jgi:hypothetical protein
VEQGETQASVGCTIEQDQTKRWMKIGCKIDREKTKQGEVMSQNDGVPMSHNMVQTYRHCVWHRDRELSKDMSSQMDAQLSRMYKVLKYVIHTASLRKILKPNAVWDGVNRNFEADNEEDVVVNREEVVIAVPWMRNNLMPFDAGICTKNDGGSDFVRYRDVCVRDTP